ncbi:MAG TPA: hypothetical protein VHF47_00385 [Acidimicrobiales bacterium]|nr:hypothetical protein [Acidimicrobiales bacterium]
MLWGVAQSAQPSGAGSGDVAIAAIVVSGAVAVLAPVVAGWFQLRATDRAAERQRLAATEAWEREEARRRKGERVQAYVRVVGLTRRRLLDINTARHLGPGPAMHEVAREHLMTTVEYEEAMFLARFGATSPVRTALAKLGAIHRDAGRLVSVPEDEQDEVWVEISRHFAEVRQELLEAVERELGKVPDMKRAD